MISIKTIAYINNHAILLIGNKHVRALDNTLRKLKIESALNIYHYRASEVNTDTLTEHTIHSLNDLCLFNLGSDRHYNVRKIHIFFTTELSDSELSEAFIKIRTYVHDDRMLVLHCRGRLFDQINDVLDIRDFSKKTEIVNMEPCQYTYVFDSSEYMKFVVNDHKVYNIHIDRSSGTVIRIDQSPKELEFIKC